MRRSGRAKAGAAVAAAVQAPAVVVAVVAAVGLLQGVRARVGAHAVKWVAAPVGAVGVLAVQAGGWAWAAGGHGASKGERSRVMAEGQWAQEVRRYNVLHLAFDEVYWVELAAQTNGTSGQVAQARAHLAARKALGEAQWQEMVGLKAALDAHSMDTYEVLHAVHKEQASWVAKWGEPQVGTSPLPPDPDGGEERGATAG